jgi:glutamyl-tRNA synthetase
VGIKTRFAPSPTGFLHVGGARSALYNWAVVKQEKNKGGEAAFVLRIEDTDEARNQPEWTQAILNALAWLGLNWDEGPIFQSDNLNLHRQAAYKLYESGLAYWCRCTRDEINERTKSNVKPGYDRFCRDLNIKEGQGTALRFKVPDSGSIEFNDEIRGKVKVDCENLEDFIILKSNKSPLFILANVVDDIYSGITHVIRGEEHLPNTPKYILLYNAISPSTEVPVFAHVPLLVNEKRQKLSKRRDNVALEYYIELGILPEAMFNYLAVLGWSDFEDEIFDMNYFLQHFNLSKVNKSPAFFDEKRLYHINGIYIRNLDPLEFQELIMGFLAKKTKLTDAINEKILNLAPLIQERCTVISEVWNLVSFLFTPPAASLMREANKLPTPIAKEFLTKLLAKIESCDWKTDVLHTITRETAEDCGQKLSKAQGPLRLALTGQSYGLPLFDIMVALGREETINRVKIAINCL